MPEGILREMTKYWVFIFVFTLISCKGTKENSSFLGEDYAKKALTEAKSDTLGIFLVDKKLINSEATAINFAEVILFKVYGKTRIEKERPYEIHLVEGYWIINGTIPKGARGGAFEIIFNSRDGQVIRLTHYK